MTKVFLIIIAIISVLLMISMFVNVIQGQQLALNLKKEYKVSDMKYEIKNQLKLEKDLNRFLSMKKDEMFLKEYSKYKFDPIWYSNQQSKFDNVPVLIYKSKIKIDLIDEDILTWKVKSDFEYYQLLNQLFYRCNYLDFRGE